VGQTEIKKESSKRYGDRKHSFNEKGGKFKKQQLSTGDEFCKGVGFCVGRGGRIVQKDNRETRPICEHQIQEWI